MNKFDLLVFDWDGTLSDSVAHIVVSLQNACADMSIAIPSESQARQVIGLGLTEAIELIAPVLRPQDHALFIECYREHYLVPGNQKLFDGARELLAECRQRGFLLAVATGKSRRGLDTAFREAGLEVFFDASCCADECLSKPHPEMLFRLMEKLNVEPHRVLMIGDTSHDMFMALNAGVAGLAVSFGAHLQEALNVAAPLAIVHSYPEMRSWLMQNA